MTSRLITTLATLVLACAAAPALSAPDMGSAGQKLDSGLGELPHYSKWIDAKGRHPVAVRVVGETLDSGLGELPHYSKWKDQTGRDPMGRDITERATVASR